MMRRLRYTISTWVFVWMIGTPAVFGQELVDYIIAVVGNDAILYSDVMQAYQMYVLQTRKPPPSLEKSKELQENLLQQMIDARIIIAAAQRDSLDIPVDQIDNAVRQMTEQLQEQYGSDENLEQALAQENMTVRDWHRLLRKQKEEEMQQRKLEEERFGQIRISGLEVEQFYNTNRDSIPRKPVKVSISHIMTSIRPKAALEAELRARIEEIQRQIDAGADFIELAQKYSEDLASARNGGDLGFFNKGEFAAEFEEAAFALRPGEISDVVRSPYGFHLIKLEEKSGNRARVRHIFVQVQTTPEDDQRTRETLEFLRQRIINGDETFEGAADKYSEDIDSSQDGGSLGEFFFDQLQPQYQAVIEGMKVDEISAPINIKDDENSYHLIRLDAQSGGNQLNMEDDWDDIALLAKQFKWQTERRRWLDDLREEFYIDERGLDPNN